MKTSELNFSYPDNLVATTKSQPSRVMLGGAEPSELSLSHLISQFSEEDLLVVNTTKVIPARVLCESGLEVLFIKQLESAPEGNVWSVLCPVRKWSKQGETLPCGTKIDLMKRGRTQQVRTDAKLDLDYFSKFGTLPLPPYIQKLRGERKARSQDESEYQTQWAQHMGSLAAPTASLHFKQEHMDRIRSRGTQVVELCLHVGLGTFLPIHADELDGHQMHFEDVTIPSETLKALSATKERGGQVWALGTTVTRALEAWAQGHLKSTEEAGVSGATDLFIQPGYEFKVVDCLLTNFHQPESTLLAMVSAFSSLENVMGSYRWAMEQGFQLFSYGDLTVWKRQAKM